MEILTPLEKMRHKEISILQSKIPIPCCLKTTKTQIWNWKNRIIFDSITLSQFQWLQRQWTWTDFQDLFNLWNSIDLRLIYKEKDILSTFLIAIGDRKKNPRKKIGLSGTISMAFELISRNILLNSSHFGWSFISHSN